MAILPFCPGLTVEIVANGTPLPEYDDDSDRPTLPDTLTKYVEATSGAEFAIRMSFQAPFTSAMDVRFWVFVDGKHITSSYASKIHLFNNDTLVSDVRARSGTNWVARKLRFAQLKLGKVISHLKNRPLKLEPDNDTEKISEELLATLAAVGTITVKFQYGLAGKISRVGPSWSFASHDKVPEYAIKGDSKSCQVRYVHSDGVLIDRPLPGSLPR